MLEVQRLEATIHQSLPPHANIVTLYRTYETPEWLFLVLEYCPGQDLYYWLEQAQDTNGDLTALSSPHASGTSTPLSDADGTPPSPSLLASTAGTALLSRRRLKLISKMFRQMCEAVQFCHDRGISHRDIKPENFIVEDRRGEAEAEAGQEDEDGFSSSRVVVKLTDFGLATAEPHCRDFDCGSKPYM
ncbi:Pkinase-domain-containing protein, partial [Jaminaea rosea]